MKKIFRGLITALTASVSVLAVALSGCSSVPYVTSIEQTGTDGLNNIYTVYYSDGTTSEFTVSNGKNGVDGDDGDDGSDVSIMEIYEKYKQETGEDLTFAEFIGDYLSLNADSSLAIGECLLSAMKVYTEFVETKYTMSIFGRPSTVTDVSMYTGSAVVWDVDDDYTYIVTNYHVVYDASADVEKNGGSLARSINCYLYGSEDTPVSAGTGADGYASYEYGSYAIECEFVGGSAVSDIAVIRAKTADVMAINDGVKAVNVADGYYVGETALAIGNSEDFGLSVTKGIVSIDNEYINLTIDTARYYRSIRIDTAIYGGNSGGGLFNSSGELIGITNAGNTSDENINYAIPVEIVRGTVENILYYYKDGDDTTNGAYKITLGVSVASKNAKYVYYQSLGYGRIEEDVVISSVSEGSIAQSIGLSSGDSIKALSVNGREFEVVRDFNISDILLAIRAGDVVSVIYEREGATCETDDYTVKATDLAAIA